VLLPLVFVRAEMAFSLLMLFVGTRRDERNNEFPSINGMIRAQFDKDFSIPPIGPNPEHL